MNPLARIKVPRAEKKVAKALDTNEVNELIEAFGDTFEGKRNKAIILVFVDCGLRLGELLHLKLNDMDMNQQLLRVDGKTGERVVGFGMTTARDLSEYLKPRQVVAGNAQSLWLTREGATLKESSVETMFRALSRRMGIVAHPHLLRHTFAALCLKNGGDSLMLQSYWDIGL